MSSILTQSLGAILANLADVIEGGNAHRGSGDARAGIPGTQSHLAIVDEVDDFAVAAATNTTIDAPIDIGTRVNEDFVKANTPPLFLLCTAGAASDSIGAARKISAYAPANRRFTTAAWPTTLSVADTVALREGFKRAPDKQDLDDPAGAPDGGFDRFFELRALPGERTDWLGNGVEQWRATLELRLRFEKRGRAQKVLDAALENVGIIRSVLRRPSLRDGTYMQLLVPDAAPPERTLDNSTLLTLRDRYSMTYRVRSDYR